MTFSEYQALSRTLHSRADQLTRSIVQDARNTARTAGLDPNICFLHAHNAVCGSDVGRPWPEVNYSLARRVLWLEQRSYEPGRIVDRILSRAFATVPR